MDTADKIFTTVFICLFILLGIAGLGLAKVTGEEKERARWCTAVKGTMLEGKCVMLKTIDPEAM